MPTGVDISKFVNGLRQNAQRIRSRAKLGVDKFGEATIGLAQTFTPVKTGFLQGSGTTEPAEIKGNRITKIIGFNTYYAAAVHNILTNNHLVGQAMYLARAMKEKAKLFKSFMAGWMKGAE